MNNLSIRKSIAAARTLEGLGYTYHDGELWKPPLGKSAEPLLDRITKLEAQLANEKKDAERYLKLRRMAVELSLSHQVISQFVTNQGELDAAIAEDAND